MDDISQWEVLLRVLVAGGLGALIGLERERTRRAAGVRTHALVAVGSALLTASTVLFVHDGGGGEAVRIAAGIITGVGFIGAGTILTSQGRVRGLTTAATIWVTAGIGITVGYGYLLLAALIAGPVTVTILLLGIGEKRLEESLEAYYEEKTEDDEPGAREQNDESGVRDQESRPRGEGEARG